MSGILQPSVDPTGTAVVLVLSSLGLLVLHDHLERLLGVDLTDAEPDMAESLTAHTQDPADYLNRTVFDRDELSNHDVLDALASLGITLVEDPVSDSTHTYCESLAKPDQGIALRSAM